MIYTSHGEIGDGWLWFYHVLPCFTNIISYYINSANPRCALKISDELAGEVWAGFSGSPRQWPWKYSGRIPRNAESCQRAASVSRVWATKNRLNGFKQLVVFSLEFRIIHFGCPIIFKHFHVIYINQTRNQDWRFIGWHRHFQQGALDRGFFTALGIQMFFPVTSWSIFDSPQKYPLVNCYITMENHHV
jgi:hypothetical protein